MTSGVVKTGAWRVKLAIREVEDDGYPGLNVEVRINKKTLALSGLSLRDQLVVEIDKFVSELAKQEEAKKELGYQVGGALIPKAK